MSHVLKHLITLKNSWLHLISSQHPIRFHILNFLNRFMQNRKYIPS